MNISTFLLVTTFITGVGLDDNATEQKLDFRDIKVEEWSREYTSSLKNCKDIAFGRGMYEIAHTDTKKKVILNSNNIVYSTSPKLDAVDFKEQKFLKLPDANKYFKQMNVRDYDDGKYKIEISFGNRNAILVQKMIMECLEVRK